MNQLGISRTDSSPSFLPIQTTLSSQTYEAFSLLYYLNSIPTNLQVVGSIFLEYLRLFLLMINVGTAKYYEY